MRQSSNVASVADKAKGHPVLQNGARAGYIFRVLRSNWRCPRVANRFEYTVVGVPVMGGESPTASIHSAVGLEPDA